MDELRSFLGRNSEPTVEAFAILNRPGRMAKAAQGSSVGTFRDHQNHYDLEKMNKDSGIICANRKPPACTLPACCTHTLLVSTHTPSLGQTELGGLQV